MDVESTVSYGTDYGRFLLSVIVGRPGVKKKMWRGLKEVKR